ncbi:MAG: ATP-binding protein [Clostridium sp.]|nr:ATP-binding protein [Clostridium sp.]
METIFDIRVALSELIQNALRHGNKGDKNKYIKVNAGITSDGYAFFVVEDEGEGFDYRDLVRETDDLMQLKESGRGVIIVEGLCDKLKFNEKGNKAVILKKLT